MTTTTHTLEAPGAVLTYDVHEPSAPSALTPVVVFGSPMGASGFAQLVEHLGDRTVITYDPRGGDRSTVAPDGEVTVPAQADDLHRIVTALGLGPVDAFGSSGGAVVGLSWIEQHPEDLRTFVAHEPPLTAQLEDRDMAAAVQADIVETYQREGYGPAMAKFIQLVMYAGPLPDDYLDQPAPDPAMFGLPTEDDGSRDDLLLGKNLATMPSYEPDADALRSTSVRLVPALGSTGEGSMAWRGGVALATMIGVDPVVFPGDHGGFMVSEFSPDNDPAAFAATLRDVLAG
ncbi:alpha/beta fold hydrolase [Oerskovia flava]|uniref:alpha/beta fold hydrolase n=1 Tax=Oerskovia flava TaxID=2986422 RepID=UPI00223E9F30|nr:alpha/beta fold hydrolase [Oerskovia sp. JB1-3-2]